MIPDWLPEDLWEEFCGHRDDLKKPLTERAKRMALRRLEKFRAEGCNVEDMLEVAILNGWQGIWPVKNNDAKPKSAAERVRAASLRVVGGNDGNVWNALDKPVR